MAIMNRKQVETEQVEIINYEEIANKRFNSKMSPLIEKKKKIEKNINELLKEINEKGPSPELVRVVIDLREKEIEINKEISITSVKYATDFNLKSLAQNIDKAESENRGRDLILLLIPKINEIISLLPEIEKCYGREYYCPFAYTVIKNSMIGINRSLDQEIPKLKVIDKELLIKQFKERMEIVESKEMREQSIKDKYTL